VANLIFAALRDWLPAISDAPSRTGSIPQREAPQP